MILTTHALTGAVIGKTINIPWLIILLSLAIHYLMDGIRHAEYFDDRTANVKNTWWKVALDFAAGVVLIFFYLYFSDSDINITKNILLGAFFSMFPDLLTVIHWRFKKIPVLPQIKKFHSLAHRYDRFPKYSPERQWNLRNSANDIILSLIAILFLFIL